ncbi:MAG: GNAT family N-acetyltransferase [Alphaproteobacteria bacterium]|nr:GNAT family N-acetyltransferase [Alphaproteobacteria bacterium]
MSFAITPLQDAVHLAGLHESAFSPAIGAAWDAPAFAALLRQDSVRAFGTAAGFILLQSVAEEAEILTLAVHPKARRSGLARALIEQAQDTLSVARVFLEVAEDNAPARALYAACGFIETGRRSAYYKRPDGSRVDALLLQRQAGENLPK